MQHIWGGYAEVEFTDGSRGAYLIAQEYYRDFDKLRTQSPEKFNELCHSVLGKPKAWGVDEKSVLSAIGRSFSQAANSNQVAQMEEEVRAFIKIAVRSTAVSRLLGALKGSVPDYDLQSPFKHHVMGRPDIVPECYQQDVAFEWMGNDLRSCPGKYLITQSSSRVKAIQQLQPNGM